MTCGFSDFDFLIGQWKVRHRRLKQYLACQQGWWEFAGRTEARKILGGFGIMDENILFERRGTYRSISLRTFDTTTNSWSIWWYDSRIPARFSPPVTGKFDDGVGLFLGERMVEGTPAQVRYLWTPDDSTPRCELALSTNGGRTWETHWIMELCRVT